MYTLRDYQVIMENRIRQAIREGKKSILCVLPTGGGKTVIFADIASKACRKNSTVYTIVHRDEIFRQTLEKYSAFGVSAGQIHASRMMTKNQIQVAMAQTMVNRLDKLDFPHLVIIDEGHHARANTWMKILNHFNGAIKLFFTATPERYDGQGLGDICDCMIEGPTISELVQGGWLVFPKILQPPPELVGNFHITRGDFDAEEQRKFLTRRIIVGNVIEHHRKYLSGLPTISFVANLRHGELMEKIYNDAGIRAKLIRGGQQYMAERNRACKMLADGSIEILISCNVISEGFDLPAVCGCHLLRRTMSLGLYLQQAGRTLRPIFPLSSYLETRQGRLAAIKKSCKPVSHILDFVGNSLLHDHVIINREWNLNSEKRSSRKRDITTTRCPRCEWISPGKPRRCPACGYDFVAASIHARNAQIKQIEAELVDALPWINVDTLHEISSAAAGTPTDKHRLIFSQAIKLVRAGDDRRKLKELVKAIGFHVGLVDHAWKWAKKKVYNRKN